MSDTNSPLGKHLKSVATYLTRWVRSKPEAKRNIEETKESNETKEGVKPSIAPVAVRAKRVAAPKKIIAVEKAIVIPEPEPLPKPSSATGLLTAFPEHTNLVGQSVDMKIDGKTRNLIIRTDSLFLDAQKYIVSASGGALGADVELDILECKRSGNTLSLKAGAFGKDASITWTEQEWEEIVDMLLRGKTCKCKTDRGQTLEIKRNNY